MGIVNATRLKAHFLFSVLAMQSDDELFPIAVLMDELKASYCAVAC